MSYQKDNHELKNNRSRNCTRDIYRPSRADTSSAQQQYKWWHLVIKFGTTWSSIKAAICVKPFLLMFFKNLK